MREDVEHRESLATGQNHYPGPQYIRAMTMYRKNTFFHEKGNILNVSAFLHLINPGDGPVTLHLVP